LHKDFSTFVRFISIGYIKFFIPITFDQDFIVAELSYTLILFSKQLHALSWRLKHKLIHLCQLRGTDTVQNLIKCWPVFRLFFHHLHNYVEVLINKIEWLHLHRRSFLLFRLITRVSIRSHMVQNTSERIDLGFEGLGGEIFCLR